MSAHARTRTLPYAAVIPKALFALMQSQAPPVHGDGRQSDDFT
ncbi:hypothetical protein DFAR_3610010 [Desulfarculales bacterium]